MRAWRCWKVGRRNGDYALVLLPVGVFETHQILSQTWWNPVAHSFQPPTRDDTVGIYSYKYFTYLIDDNELVCRFNSRPRGLWAGAIGEIELAGKVIEHENGYRSEKAIVRSLFVPDCTLVPNEREQLAARYQVPVRTFSCITRVAPCCCVMHAVKANRLNSYWQQHLAANLFHACEKGEIRNG